MNMLETIGFAVLSIACVGVILWMIGALDVNVNLIDEDDK